MGLLGWDAAWYRDIAQSRLRRRARKVGPALLPAVPAARPRGVVAPGRERGLRGAARRERERARGRECSCTSSPRSEGSERRARAPRGVARVSRAAGLRARDGLRGSDVHDRAARRAARAAEPAVVDRGARGRRRPGSTRPVGVLLVVPALVEVWRVRGAVDAQADRRRSRPRSSRPASGRGAYLAVGRAPHRRLPVPAARAAGVDEPRAAGSIRSARCGGPARQAADGDHLSAGHPRRHRGCARRADRRAVAALAGVVHGVRGRGGRSWRSRPATSTRSSGTASRRCRSCSPRPTSPATARASASCWSRSGALLVACSVLAFSGCWCRDRTHRVRVRVVPARDRRGRVRRARARTSRSRSAVRARSRSRARWSGSVPEPVRGRRPDLLQRRGQHARGRPRLRRAAVVGDASRPEGAARGRSPAAHRDRARAA